MFYLLLNNIIYIIKLQQYTYNNNDYDYDCYY